MIVRTSGGEATLISINGLQSVALSGTPANAAIPSANPGQTIRLAGEGITLSTEIIFPIIDSSGNISNQVVRPDLASVDGTLGEVRVPNNAITGNLQVVGAAGTFPLQVVPTLALAEIYGSTDLRLLGGGFTEGSSLSVTVNGRSSPTRGRAAAWTWWSNFSATTRCA